MVYHKTDFLLETDAFEKFRDQCVQFNEIDPCYKYFNPGLAWLCKLKYNGARILKKKPLNFSDTI